MSIIKRRRGAVTKVPEKDGPRQSASMLDMTQRGRVARSASSQLGALIEEFVDLATRPARRRARGLSAHDCQQSQFAVDGLPVAHGAAA